jgi:AAA ATPase domain
MLRTSPAAIGPQADDHIMISTVDIRNFRCFSEVKIKGLKRFTFVVGEGGAGKTALLEALFLSGGGNAEIYFRIRLWRGFGDTIEIAAGRAAYESVFRDLFHNFDSDTGAYIRIEDPDRGYRKLDILYEGSATLDLPLRPSAEKSGDSFSVVPITFRWETPKRISVSQVEIDPHEPYKFVRWAQFPGAVYVLMIPFDASGPLSGCLETVLLPAATAHLAKHVSCLDTWCKCIGIWQLSKSHHDKVRLRSLLSAAYPEDPNIGLQYAISPSKDLIPLSHSCFDLLANRIKDLPNELAAMERK